MSALLTLMAKRVFADLTAIALPLAIMDTDIALFPLASCRTRQIRAKLFRRIHRLVMFLLHKHIMPMFVTFFKPPLPISPDHVALPTSNCFIELVGCGGRSACSFIIPTPCVFYRARVRSSCIIAIWTSVSLVRAIRS